MKKVLIITHYFGLYSEGGNSRFATIATMLEGDDVQILTSQFDHKTKSYREFDYQEENNYRVTFVPSKAYTKNISLARFASDISFGKSVKKYLESSEKPDVIYLAVPSLAVGCKVVDYCKKHNVRLIIDVQDLWPEAFRMVFNPPIVAGMIYYPLKKMADKIYKNADAIVAVSDTYCQRAMRVNKKVDSSLCVYLGTSIQKFDDAAKDVQKPSNDILTIGYVGTLGASYRLDLIMRAMAKADEYAVKAKFKIIGDGHKRTEFEELAKELGIECEFFGQLDYQNMVKELVTCDIAVNPIKDGSAASIINKVGDYAMAGLPVINTQDSQEYIDKVAQLNIGINCSNKDIDGIARAIVTLNDINIREEMGKNNREWAISSFDRDTCYNKIVEIIRE